VQIFCQGSDLQGEVPFGLFWVVLDSISWFHVDYSLYRQQLHQVYIPMTMADNSDVFRMLRVVLLWMGPTTHYGLI